MKKILTSIKETIAGLVGLIFLSPMIFIDFFDTIFGTDFMGWKKIIEKERKEIKKMHKHMSVCPVCKGNNTTFNGNALSDSNDTLFYGCNACGNEYNKEFKWNITKG